MGLLAASSAVANLLGTISAGPLVEWFGYRVLRPIAIAGLLSAAVLIGKVRVISEAPEGVTVEGATVNLAEAPDPVLAPSPVEFPNSAPKPRK